MRPHLPRGNQESSENVPVISFKSKTNCFTETRSERTDTGRSDVLSHMIALDRFFLHVLSPSLIRKGLLPWRMITKSPPPQKKKAEEQSDTTALHC